MKKFFDKNSPENVGKSPSSRTKSASDNNSSFSKRDSSDRPKKSFDRFDKSESRASRPTRDSTDRPKKSFDRFDKSESRASRPTRDSTDRPKKSFDRFDKSESRNKKPSYDSKNPRRPSSFTVTSGENKYKSTDRPTYTKKYEGKDGSDRPSYRDRDDSKGPRKYTPKDSDGKYKSAEKPSYRAKSENRFESKDGERPVYKDFEKSKNARPRFDKTSENESNGSENTTSKRSFTVTPSDGKFSTQDKAKYSRDSKKFDKGEKRDPYLRPEIRLETTTLWDYPSQSYGHKQFGDQNYAGVTPAFIVWNVLNRYTKKNDLMVDPMCGSGTSIDVAMDLGRRAIGYDLQPQRPEIFLADSRTIPLEKDKADFVFIDPPYSTHIKYSGKPECIGELNSLEPEYYKAMTSVISEIHRILKPGKHMALYVSDSFEKDIAFMPIGFELFNILKSYFTPVDIMVVKRHNAKLGIKTWNRAAEEENFFLRGFNYLFIMKKEK